MGLFIKTLKLIITVKYTLPHLCLSNRDLLLIIPVSSFKVSFITTTVLLMSYFPKEMFCDQFLNSRRQRLETGNEGMRDTLTPGQWTGETRSQKSGHFVPWTWFTGDHKGNPNLQIFTSYWSYITQKEIRKTKLFSLTLNSHY